MSAISRLPREARKSPTLNSNFWSGARDLNPGPHGPEPSLLHVLECPADSTWACGGKSQRGPYPRGRSVILT